MEELSPEDFGLLIRGLHEIQRDHRKTLADGKSEMAQWELECTVKLEEKLRRHIIHLEPME